MSESFVKGQPGYPGETGFGTDNQFDGNFGLRGASPVTRIDEAVIQQTIEDQDYRELEVAFDMDERILWYAMNPENRPSYTVGLIQEIRRLQDCVSSVFARSPDTMGPPIRYMVLGSALPGIFNLGGDLGLFAQLIRQKNRSALKSYARLAIGAVHTNAVNLNLPMITISLVQGDALGGGFEAALSSNLLIAERGTKFALPEILFNLFPGMGAYSLLTRKIEPVLAEKMIFSGKVYEAEELHEMGVVDILADPGDGRAKVYEYIERNTQLHSSHRAIYKVRQRVNGIDYSEMADIADIWVEAALSLGVADLRRMDRLASAQDRRWLKTKSHQAPISSLDLVSV